MCYTKAPAPLLSAPEFRANALVRASEAWQGNDGASMPVRSEAPNIQCVPMGGVTFFSDRVNILFKLNIVYNPTIKGAGNTTQLRRLHSLGCGTQRAGTLVTSFAPLLLLALLCFLACLSGPI